MTCMRAAGSKLKTTHSCFSLVLFGKRKPGFNTLIMWKRTASEKGKSDLKVRGNGYARLDGKADTRMLLIGILVTCKFQAV